MTRANTEQSKFVPWFAKAGAACSIVPISRFIGLNIFALKGGGYGCLFALNGIDEEGLTDQDLESRMRSIEGALRGLPEGSCLYQYTRVMSGYELPRRKQYSNPVTQVFVDDRLTFLEKTARFRRIDLHWCLTLEPSKLKAFERTPQENATDTSRMLAELQKTATILEGHLGNLLGLGLLDKNKALQFLSYLFNLEEWAMPAQLRDDNGVDRQIVSNPVAWHSDHLRVGKRYVQMFSLKTTPEASQPCLFSGLLTLDCDSVLCSTWRPKSASAARGEIDAQEKFISFFKVGVLTRVMSGRDTASLDTGAGAKAANSSVDDLSLVIRELDKKAQGEYSLRLLLAANSAEQLRDTAPAVHRIFVDARAQVIEETLGNLCAFYAMFPGNGRFNVFPMWLSEEHHARLSSVFAPHIGHPHSDDLDAEYLNIFETRTRTPFFQDVYVDGVRVMLIIGPTGSGKSVIGNATVALEQKYGGFTYIFDIGGSYESVVELYGGRVDRIGKDGPRVALFALEPAESNIKFLYSFIKLLLTNGGAELEPEDDDVIHKAVQDIYLLDPENRRLSNLFLPKKLDRYLSKWVGRGVYSAVFDNVEDSLSLSRVQSSGPATIPEQKHLQPDAPRTITVSEADTPPIVRAGLLQSTLILLPAEEKVANVFAGDTVDWVFDGGHVASRFVSIKPKLANSTTDVHIISDHGNEYTLQLREVSGDDDPHFDSKIFITPGDKAAKDRLAELPLFVPAAELDKVKQEVAAAQVAQAATLKTEKSREEEYRSQYPGSLHFDYRWDKPKGKELGLQEIWRDDKFTYLRGQFHETPALYEVKDKKPSLINFDFSNGLYTVPKELDNGYLAIGKQKVEFHRTEEAR